MFKGDINEALVAHKCQQLQDFKYHSPLIYDFQPLGTTPKFWKRIIEMERSCDFHELVGIANTLIHLLAIEYGEEWLGIQYYPQQTNKRFEF